MMRESDLIAADRLDGDGMLNTETVGPLSFENVDGADCTFGGWNMEFCIEGGCWKIEGLGWLKILCGVVWFTFGGVWKIEEGFWLFNIGVLNILPELFAKIPVLVWVEYWGEKTEDWLVFGFVSGWEKILGVGLVVLGVWLLYILFVLPWVLNILLLVGVANILGLLLFWGLNILWLGFWVLAGLKIPPLLLGWENTEVGVLVLGKKDPVLKIEFVAAGLAWNTLLPARLLLFWGVKILGFEFCVLGWLNTDCCLKTDWLGPVEGLLFAVLNRPDWLPLLKIELLCKPKELVWGFWTALGVENMEGTFWGTLVVPPIGKLLPKAFPWIDEFVIVLGPIDVVSEVTPTELGIPALLQ